MARPIEDFPGKTLESVTNVQVLIIEDDAELAGAISDYLELKGIECDFAYSGSSGLELALHHAFDVIILDIMLPRMNGLEVCSVLRKRGITTPVLMLTAFDSQQDQLDGFQAGSDDYVIKPCPMPLLLARLQALARRTRTESPLLQVGDLRMDLAQHTVTRDGKPLSLTPTCWRILCYLMQCSPRVVNRQELEKEIWNDEELDTGNLNVHMHKLRQVVDKPFKHSLIHTLVGVGIVIRDNRSETDNLA